MKKIIKLLSISLITLSYLGLTVNKSIAQNNQNTNLKPDILMSCYGAVADDELFIGVYNNINQVRYINENRPPVVLTILKKYDYVHTTLFKNKNTIETVFDITTTDSEGMVLDFKIRDVLNRGYYLSVTANGTTGYYNCYNLKK